LRFSDLGYPTDLAALVGPRIALSITGPLDVATAARAAAKPQDQLPVCIHDGDANTVPRCLRLVPAARAGHFLEAIRGG
jgi:hypothetical protein